MNNKNIFPINGVLKDTERLYEQLQEHSYGLNNFQGRIKDEIFENIYLDRPQQLKITLDYLEPLLKEGKLEVRIGEGFSSRKEFGLLLNCIKTEGYRELIKNVLNDTKIDNLGYLDNGYKDFIYIPYDYKTNEIETFKEDVKNIMFKYYKTDIEKQSFEECHIGFRLPGTEWDRV